MRIKLPFGSPRPPLLRVELWQAPSDEDADGGAWNTLAAYGPPQASADIRMPEVCQEGKVKMTVLMVGALGFNKDVKLTFKHKTVLS